MAKRYRSLSSLGNRIATLAPRFKLPTRERDQSNRDRGRLGRLWRKEVLERDHYLCRMCSTTDRPVAAHEVDHILALVDGGADLPSNMWSLCIPCHRNKTANEVAARAAGLPPPFMDVRPPVLPPDTDDPSDKYRVF